MGNPTADAGKLFTAAVAAADPETAVKRNLILKNGRLEVAHMLSLPIDNYTRVFITAAGKASVYMARAVSEITGRYLTGGIVIGTTPADRVNLHRSIKYYRGGHPLPDRTSLRATAKLIALLKSLSETDLVINLISGGGSSLLCAPADGISFGEKVKTNALLLNCGASISEINTIRKHISSIKGGFYSKYARNSTVITLAMSDVPDNSIGTIASGPTVPDTSTYKDCMKIIEKYRIRKNLPPAVTARLVKGVKGLVSETPKYTDSAALRNKHNFIIASSSDALNGALKCARRLGYKTTILPRIVSGSPEDNAALHMIPVNAHAATRKKLCFLSGGEMSVKVSGRGKGGRCMQFCLEIARKISGMKNITILSAGTDGIDGPTDAAGAIVDGNVIARGEKLGLDAEKFIENNDSYDYFRQTGNLLITGPTKTNVMGIQIILIGKFPTSC